MAITPAGTHGGRRGRVHAEFDDSILLGYYEGDDFVPILFPYENEFGEIECALIRIDGKLYHGRLMRKDGGVCIQDESEAITMSWSQLEKQPYGYTMAPDGTYHEAYGYCLNRECDVAIDELTHGRRLINRLDKYYWTPDNVTQNAKGQNDPFSLEQFDPCHEDFKYDKCGNPTLEYKDEKQICYSRYQGGKR